MVVCRVYDLTAGQLAIEQEVHSKLRYITGK